MRDGVLAVVSGFAGSGKGTITQALIEQHDGYALSVSATTRDPRPGEQEGVHYFFKTEAEFEEMVRRDAFLEHASYVGHSYGTPRAYVEEMLRAGRDVILEIDVQGALQIKRRMEDALLIFVTPPSAQELHRRLSGRGTETPEQICKRLKRAAEEADLMAQYDYILVNDTVEASVEEMHRMIRAAHTRPAAQSRFIERIRAELITLSDTLTGGTKL